MSSGEQLEDEVIDAATAADRRRAAPSCTSSGELESIAAEVRASREDRKWTKLSELLQAEQFLRGNPRKLIIFSEHKDTLNYLVERIRSLVGRNEAVVAIHGGMKRRTAAAQEAFRSDPTVQIRRHRRCG